jgi:RNA polymerase primary sigma factor
MAEDSEASIKIYLREIMQTPLLTAQQEIELAARIKKGDQKARAWMIKANLRLVVKIAHDYSNLGLPLLDLISEGNIGLMKAVERFDPAKGGKLSTYGGWWIKQSIKRALANQSKTIRLPIHLIDKIYKLYQASLTMSEELGREPTDEELSEEIGISSAKLSQLKRVSIRPASLDAPISDDDSTEFAEIVGDEDAQTPFELFRDKNMRAELRELLEVLDDRERKIILNAIRVGRRQTGNSRRSWKEIRSDQRENPAVAEYRAGETAWGARQEGEAERTARPHSIP